MNNLSLFPAVLWRPPPLRRHTFSRPRCLISSTMSWFPARLWASNTIAVCNCLTFFAGFISVHKVIAALRKATVRRVQRSVNTFTLQNESESWVQVRLRRSFFHLVFCSLSIFTLHVIILDYQSFYLLALWCPFTAFLLHSQFIKNVPIIQLRKGHLNWLSIHRLTSLLSPPKPPPHGRLSETLPAGRQEQTPAIP